MPQPGTYSSYEGDDYDYVDYDEKCPHDDDPSWCDKCAAEEAKYEARKDWREWHPGEPYPPELKS